MSLIVPSGPNFTRYTSNLVASPNANQGTAFTAGANNADGTAVTLLSALAFDVHYVVLSIMGLQLSTIAVKGLGDLLIDPAGGTAWTEIAPDLVCGYTTLGLGTGRVFMFPLYIKAGASIGWRARVSHTATAAGRAYIEVYGAPTRPEMWWCGSKVEPLGVTPASSSGVTVTPGATGVWGSWTNIGTSTKPYGAIQFSVNGSDNNMVGVEYYAQIGIGGAQIPGTPTHQFTGVSTENISHSRIGSQPLWCQIPSGTTFQMRLMPGGAGENFDCAVYGVY